MTFLISAWRRPNLTILQNMNAALALLTYLKENSNPTSKITVKVAGWLSHHHGEILYFQTGTFIIFYINYFDLCSLFLP